MMRRVGERDGEDGTAGGAADAPPTGKRSPGEHRHHWLRWGLIAAAAFVVLVVLVGVVLFVGREEATQRTADEVLEQLREQGHVTAPPSAVGPAAGVYPGVGQGNEYVGFSPLDEPFGPSIPATVTYTDDSCWTYRIELNSHHSRSWELCTDEDALAQQVGDTVTARAFPGIDFENTSTFVCDPPSLILRRGAGTGDTAEATCLGTATGLEGETEFVGVSTVVGPETLDIDGAPVDVVRVRREATLTGAQNGLEVVEWWIEPETGLPVRIEFDTNVSTDTPFGSIDYRDVGSVELTSLSPRS